MISSYYSVILRGPAVLGLIRLSTLPVFYAEPLSPVA